MRSWHDKALQPPPVPRPIHRQPSSRPWRSRWATAPWLDGAKWGASSFTLAAPWIGRLCDRGDPKRLLLWSIVGRVAATGAILFCRDYVLFLALVGLRSVFASVAPLAINVLAVRSVVPSERPHFFSLLNVVNNAAKIIAPAIGTVSSSLSSEAVALVMSLAFSSAAFLAFAWIGLDPKPQRCDAATDARGSAAAGSGLTPLLWIAATYAFSVFMVSNLVPLVLQQSGFDKALLIGTVSARYAIALNVHLSTHRHATIGSVSGLLQAWQNAMIFVAPMIGAVVLDALGVPWLFAFAAGSTAVSFVLFLALRMFRGLRLVTGFRFRA